MKRACVAALLSIGLGCSSSPLPSAAPRPPRNLLLVSIDSLRADHLGSYGYARDTSPTIDRLAANGVRFADAQSPMSWTLPSHVTLLSGLSQESHRIITSHDRISPTDELVAEVFARNGFETVGFFSGPYLDPVFGFARGFASYVSCQSGEKKSGGLRRKASHEDRTNGLIAARFRRWIADRKAADRPFFAFVHMWDVHFDYIPPEPYASMFDPSYGGPLDGRRIIGKGFPLDASPRDVEHLEALYDGEIRWTDATLDVLLKTLEAHHLLDDTLVVVTADHGEEFLEHGGKTHERTLFQEVLHVPLVVWAKSGMPRGKVIDRPVRLEDVAPTILDLMRLPALAKPDGRSLVPLIDGLGQEQQPQFGVLYSNVGLYLASARQDDEKIIYDATDDAWVAYELGSDPGERHPRPVRDEDEPLKVALQGYVERARDVAAHRAKMDRQGDGKLPASVEERLRSLGYLR